MPLLARSVSAVAALLAVLSCPGHLPAQTGQGEGNVSRVMEQGVREAGGKGQPSRSTTQI